MKILVLNAGSSNLKAALREIGPGQLPPAPTPALWEARAEWGGRPQLEVVRALIAPVADRAREIDVVAHRVVHGGELVGPAAISPEVLAEIRKWAELAPAHRMEIDVIDAAMRMFGPETRQMAVFDTAFHRNMPLEARVYPGPYSWFEQGIERFGFHGISHQFTARRAAEILGRQPEGLRLLTCHLGNGASLAAVRDGRSVDTTMGFTPLEGLMMGARSGSIDPGIVIHLVRVCGYSADALDKLLNEESGLKGVSGISGDMREILKAIGAGSRRARLAFDIYVHRLAKEIAAMAASLGGVDALVFTAGVGENTPRLRAAVCERVCFLGVEVDADRNTGTPADADIATPDSRVRVLVVRTNEEWEIARECYLSLAPPPVPPPSTGGERDAPPR